MSDKKDWITGFVSGMGEVAMWIEPHLLQQAMTGGALLPVENLTQIMIGPQGMGLRPLMANTTLNTIQVVAFSRAHDALKKDLSRAWDAKGGNGIVLPSDRDRLKFGK